VTATYVLTPRARDDLASIADYTLSIWGEAQMRVYLDALLSRVEWLSENPMLGRPRPEIAPHLRSWREGSHIIFYRTAEDRIQIIGVPHQSMDLDGMF